MDENVVLSLSLSEAEDLRGLLVDYSAFLKEQSERFYALSLRIVRLLLDFELAEDVSPETGAPFPDEED